jgi:hypothetical protein
MPILLVAGYPEMVEHEQPLPGPVFVKPVELSPAARVPSCQSGIALRLLPSPRKK